LGDAGDGEGGVEDVAAGGEGEFFDAFGVEVGADFGVGGVDEGGFAGDVDGFGGGLDFEFDEEFGVLVELEGEGALDVAGEAGGFDGEFVVGGGELGDAEAAVGPVEAALRKPVARFLMETLALATAAPEGSETAPRTEPVVWAEREAAHRRAVAARRRSVFRVVDFSIRPDIATVMQFGYSGMHLLPVGCMVLGGENE